MKRPVADTAQGYALECKSLAKPVVSVIAKVVDMGVVIGHAAEAILAFKSVSVQDFATDSVPVRCIEVFRVFSKPLQLFLSAV